MHPLIVALLLLLLGGNPQEEISAAAEAIVAALKEGGEDGKRARRYFLPDDDAQGIISRAQALLARVKELFGEEELSAEDTVMAGEFLQLRRNNTKGMDMTKFVQAIFKIEVEKMLKDVDNEVEVDERRKQATHWLKVLRFLSVICGRCNCSPSYSSYEDKPYEYGVDIRDMIPPLMKPFVWKFGGIDTDILLDEEKPVLVMLGLGFNETTATYIYHGCYAILIGTVSMHIDAVMKMPEQKVRSILVRYGDKVRKAVPLKPNSGEDIWVDLTQIYDMCRTALEFID